MLGVSCGLESPRLANSMGRALGLSQAEARAQATAWGDLRQDTKQRLETASNVCADNKFLMDTYILRPSTASCLYLWDVQITD